MLLLIIIIKCSLAVWPIPARWWSSEGRNATVVVSPQDFSFSGGGGKSRVLAAAFERYRDIFFPHSTTTTTADPAGVVVEVADPDAELGDGDERYSLRIVGGWARLRAATVWGALRGLETLSQLVEFDFGTERYTLRDASIVDGPRFAHRGLLIDCGRHFEPLPSLRRLVDAMAYAKLNVLHWHLTEDESFPMPSRVHPELQGKGAWSAGEKYAVSEIRKFVEYAKYRGVRVIPEFDVPGHATSWRNSHPEIFASGCGSDAKRGALDPGKNETWVLLGSQLADWAALFSDKFLHLGSDEVPSSCWNNSFDLEFMKSQNFSTFEDLYDYFVKRVVDLVPSRNHVILWDEAFQDATPDPARVVVQNWHDATLLRDIIAAGYRAVASPNAYWYLDHLATSWETMYAFDPADGLDGLDDDDGEDAPLLLGGEGCMWGETVDPSDLEPTVWPRLAAIAERLWSPRNLTADTQMAEPRLRAFRCLLLARGVRAGLVNSSLARSPPPNPGRCDQ